MSNKTNILLAHCGRDDGNIIPVVSAKKSTKKIKVKTNSEGINYER